MSHLLAILREMCKDRAKLDDTFISVHDAIWHELNCRECGIKSGPITIAVFCPWVKHRSKALARLLYHIISCRGGLAVDLPIHLSSKDCGLCDCPRGCCWPGGQGNKQKTALLDRAYRRYMGLQITAVTPQSVRCFRPSVSPRCCQGERRVDVRVSEGYRSGSRTPVA